MYGILVALERKKKAYEPYRIHTKHNRRGVPMKIKVSNYIAGKLVEAGINQVFTVTGGGAMHLNDALGHQ